MKVPDRGITITESMPITISITGQTKKSISIKVPDHGITITGSIPIMSVTGPITISATITTSTPTTLTETNRYRYLATTTAKPDR